MPGSRRAVRIALLAAAGLLVLLIAGGVSVSRWTRQGAPLPARSVPIESAPALDGPGHGSPPQPAPTGATP